VIPNTNDAAQAAALLSATLGKLGLDETHISATIARATVPPAATQTLPVLAIAPGPSPDFIVKSELGRGGMGVVNLAEQRSLDREVAVKSTLSMAADAQGPLLREARVMGRLDHPCIVPVHALGVDHEGSPHLVMKRVSGASWRALLDDPQHEGWASLLAGHDDRLRANIEILAHIARALAFAHERGVVHRDLKPENVMIGRFGEIYLLDWGVALTLSEAEQEPRAIVGTPGYLAPEMALGDARRITPQTDVFLLGATLYELLTQRMPNAAPTAIRALGIAMTGERPPPSGPADLVDLALASLSVDPASRPESAEAFRVALARWLATRELDVLLEAAHAARTRAAELSASEGKTSVAVFRALIEARFALHSALEMKADDPRVKRELDACLGALADRELALGSPAGARTYASEMSAPSPELTAAIDDADRAAQEKQRALEAVSRSRAQADTSQSVSGITIASFVLAIVWTVVGVLMTAADPHGTTSPETSFGVNAAIAFVLVLLLFFLRKRALATEATRRMTAYLFGFFAVAPLFELVAWIRGDAVYDNVPGHLGSTLYVLGGAITFVPELWPVVLWNLVALAAFLAFPDYQLAIGHFTIVPTILLTVRAIRLRGARTRRTEP
jgi:heme/copper-type cytochrome/quinol oxidase subunit 4